MKSIVATIAVLFSVTAGAQVLSTAAVPVKKEEAKPAAAAPAKKEEAKKCDPAKDKDCKPAAPAKPTEPAKK